LLLPDPTSASFCIYAGNSNGSIEKAIIADTTERARADGAEVKYTPHFLGYSVNLVDTNSPSGWAHVELVLPYSKQDKRPSFTVHKQRHPVLVNELQRVYDELWRAASDEPKTE
jgi:hypothetical protein